MTEFFYKKKDLKYIAKYIVSQLSEGDIILLYGDLGAGKSTLIKNILYELNFNINQTISPTFNLIHSYDESDFLIKHLDLYRIKSSIEIYGLDLQEFIKKSLIFVEWGSLMKEVLVGKYKEIFIIALPVPPEIS